MIERHNCRVMVILTLFCLVFKNNFGDPCDCSKMVRFMGGFGYHGNLLVFWFLVFGVSCVKFCTLVLYVRIGKCLL